jgi:branched-chain amino acid aminotransferase
MPNLTIYKIIISENRQVKIRKIPFPQKLTSLNAVSRFLPRGVYTTFRTYEGNKLLPLEHHLKRLETSARLLGYQIQLDERLMYHAIREAIRSYLPDDTRIRLTVGIEGILGETFLSIELLKSPSLADYHSGVSTVTVPLHREIPEAKQTSFIATAEQIRKRLPPHAHEGLLINENGQILEGLSSNFFYIHNQILWTAPHGVLSGITRSLVLKAASTQKIPVQFKAAQVTDIPTLEEAFLTSSTRSVLPVTKIDDCIVSNGKVGSLTKILSAGYWKEIKDQLVDLK